MPRVTLSTYENYYELWVHRDDDTHYAVIRNHEHEILSISGPLRENTIARWRHAPLSLTYFSPPHGGHWLYVDEMEYTVSATIVPGLGTV